MKKFLAILLLISPAAFAAPSSELINTTAAIYAPDLSCVANLGLTGTPLEQRMYTALGVNERSYMINLKDAELKLPLPLLTANGCNLSALDELVNTSNQFYGFIHGTPVKITKNLGSSLMVDGTCKAHYVETVEIEIDGLKMSGKTYTFLPMKDCK